ncbi:hypothetical protein ACJX0J_032939, partial [Zea mays]
MVQYLLPPYMGYFGPHNIDTNVDQVSGIATRDVIMEELLHPQESYIVHVSNKGIEE